MLEALLKTLLATPWVVVKVVQVVVDILVHQMVNSLKVEKPENEEILAINTSFVEERNKKTLIAS